MKLSKQKESLLDVGNELNKLQNNLKPSNLQKSMDECEKLHKKKPKLVNMQEATTNANVYYKDTVLMDFRGAIIKAIHDSDFKRCIKLAHRAQHIQNSKKSWFQRDKLTGKYFNLKPSGVSSVINILNVDYKNEILKENHKYKKLSPKILAKGKILSRAISKEFKINHGFPK